MPHMTQYNEFMIQASKLGEQWFATANDVTNLAFAGDTAEEAINNLKEHLDARD